MVKGKPMASATPGTSMSQRKPYSKKKSPEFRSVNSLRLILNRDIKAAIRPAVNIMSAPAIFKNPVFIMFLFNVFSEYCSAPALPLG